MGTFLWTKTKLGSVAPGKALVSLMVWQNPACPAVVLSLCLFISYCTEATRTTGTLHCEGVHKALLNWTPTQCSL